jgi:hypothetical protein
LVALVFSVREKDYGGLHLGVAAVDVTPLEMFLKSITSAKPGRAQSVSVSSDAQILAMRILPHGRFQALSSLQFQRSGQVRISVNSRKGVVELTAPAAEALGDLLARVHTSGGDTCIIGDSNTWSDRLWLWPL